MQAQDRIDPVIPHYAQEDPYSVLVNAIASAATDPARLRKLVYAMALQNRKPAAVREPTPDPVQQATTLLELEEALQFEYAVARIEQHAAELGDDDEGPPELGHLAHGDIPRDRPSATSTEHPTALVTDRLPAFLDPVTRISSGIVEYPSLPRRNVLRAGLFSFAQIAVASIAGVAFYAGIAGWVRWDRQSIATPAIASTAPAHVATSATPQNPETVGSGHPQMRQARADAEAALPFPLPMTSGVYAGSDGHIAPLQPLPISVPAGLQMSTEIMEPSRVLVSGNDLKFVVYRRDLAASAPETASVRVVARVARSMTFVNGTPTMTPVAGTWRVRDKSYQLRISPVEGHPEMLLIEPEAGFVFPSGRYALMVNRQGYDFTVPGPITAMEQCLEQFQVQNGMVLSECPKS
jgi:hypothetical protein